jgi:hypothetical protein
VVGGRRHLDPRLLAAVGAQPLRRRFEVRGRGGGVADAAGDLGDAGGQLPVEAAGQRQRQQPGGDAGAAGERDGGEDRAAEEGAEADGVAAHRVRQQPDRGRGQQVAEQDAAQLPLLGQATDDVEGAAAPERDRNEGGEREGELAGFGEGDVGDDGEGQRQAGDAERGARRAASRFDRPGEDDPGEKGGGDGAGERAGGGGGDGERAAPRLQGAQRGQGEGDPEREGQLAVGEQRHHAGGEPEGRPARLHPPAVADQTVEEVGGGDDGEPSHDLRSEQRRQRREEEAVGEGVVAAVPAAVPDRQAGLLEQLGAEDLRREVADRRTPEEHQRRQRGAESDGREPFGQEWL